ncbi:MAG TPA: nucleotidyltransferase family protein [Candidatus Polarisedimenticolia bacterium]|nr:nucleotidyltransferase family protein [Candidatus Polarisedimenticolia bacterium]
MTADLAREAARLADPSPAGGAFRAAADPRGVAELLRRNKVPLLELGGIPQVSSWRMALERERAEAGALRAELIPVIEAFASAGIEPVLFKSPGGLPYRSSNVDLLVRPARMGEAAFLLEREGHMAMPHYRERHKMLFRLFREGRPALCVHLHDAVSWGRVLVLPGDEVADRCRPSPGEPFLVASWRDLALITLAHSLYETDQVRLSDLRNLRLCAAAQGFDWEEAEAKAVQGAWGIGFHSILLIASAVERSLYGHASAPQALLARAAAEVDRRRWARGRVRRVASEAARGPVALPYPVSRVYSKVHYLVRLATEPSRSPDERAVDVAATAWNLAANRWGLRCRPAAVITLSGLDGSGKSSAMALLKEAADLCEIPSRVVWSRGGFTPWMRAVKRAARAASAGRVPGPEETARKLRWLARPLPAALYAALVVAEQSAHTVLRVRAPRMLGWTILCDRSSLDAAAELLARLPGVPGRWGARMLLRGGPRTDAAIVLRLAAATAAERKPEESDREDLSRRAAALDRLAEEAGAAVIDASRPLDAVAADVVERGLRAILGRFRRGGEAG